MANEVAVISGKGGSGKTTVTSSFAAIAGDIVIVDCDVDAPDLHILLQPEAQVSEEFQASKVAVIDPDLCIECGLCEENCRFDAAHPPEIDSIACEGCSVCTLVCPEDAIDMIPRISGHLYESDTRLGRMVHAKLLPGEGNSGLLVTEVKKRAQRIAEETGTNKILIDGSPGIGCPVIATLTGVKVATVVTEPTMSGIHDMERVVRLIRRFQSIPTVIVNKYDLNLKNTARIEAFCKSEGIELLGKIPFDSITTRSMVDATTLPEYSPQHELVKLFEQMWDRISVLLSQ
ncbi:MAG: 4Fe-4S binding protein [Candidatus Thorarchaeota archaeon]